MTDGNGRVSFEGEIPSVPSGGLTLHFVVGTLPGGWSTAGWNSLDRTVNGTIPGYVGKILGSSSIAIVFLVGVPCWLTFRYERKYGETPPALFPLGTRIKLVAVDSAGGAIERANFKTGVTSDFKGVLHNLVPGEELRMLIFTRYEQDSADSPEFRLNPCDVVTEPASIYDFQYTEVGGSPPAERAFHLTSYKKDLKDAPAWIPSADALSLCTWNNATSQIETLPTTIGMPPAFQAASFSSNVSIQKDILLCTALHAATLIREFSGFISAILAGRSQWHGLNVNAAGAETALTLTAIDGPETKWVEISGLLRGEVLLPVSTFYDALAFSIGNSNANEYRYLDFRNAILHELGHCLMFSYSFDDPIDFSAQNDHFLNFFMDYTDTDSRQLPFWEGWAVYFSMLMLGPRDFLLSQMTRVAAKDPAMKGNAAKRDAALYAISSKTTSDLTKAIENIFPNGNSFSDGIINSFTVGSRSGLSLANVLTAPELAGADVNVGQASEMCLAFSLYTLTRFLVERTGATFSGPGFTDGLGRISPGAWYDDTTVRDALWTAIFRPFLRLGGSSIRADTVRRFTRFIRAAMRNDPDWPTIKRIFNTYYLLIEAPGISSIHPGVISAGTGQQTLTVTGTRFVARSSTPGDGGMDVQLLSPGGTPVIGVTLAVDASTSIKVTAVFAVTGNYTLKLVGRWTGNVSKIVTVS